jgi:hypothetical protein
VTGGGGPVQAVTSAEPRRGGHGRGGALFVTNHRADWLDIGVNGLYIAEIGGVGTAPVFA